MLIIFGNRDFASLAHFYFKKQFYGTGRSISGFTVHEKYMDGSVFEGKPIVPFEEVEKHFPLYKNGISTKMFAPLNYNQNDPKLRERLYKECKAKGYEMTSYISDKATVYGDVGENCFILEDNTIQPYAKIGNNCVLWSGNHIGHHSIIEDHVLFTSHTVLSGHCTVGAHSFFGVNSTIKDGTKIAEGSLIGMGSLVTKDTAPWGVYIGSPAKRKKDIEVE